MQKQFFYFFFGNSFFFLKHVIAHDLFFHNSCYRSRSRSSGKPHRVGGGLHGSSPEKRPPPDKRRNRQCHHETQREKKKKSTVTDLHGSAAVFGIVCHSETSLCQLETWLLARGRASLLVVWCRGPSQRASQQADFAEIPRSDSPIFYFFSPFWHHGLVKHLAYLACLSRGTRLPLTNCLCLRVLFITQGPVGLYPSS